MACTGDRSGAYEVGGGSPEGEYLEDLDIKLRIILKWFLKWD